MSWDEWSLNVIIHFINCVNECSILMTEVYLTEQSIEARVSISILTTQYESQVFGSWMGDSLFNHPGFLVPVLSKSNCLLLSNAVWIVEECPNSLNVIGINHISNNIGILIHSVTSNVQVTTLRLPDCQCSVSHFNVSIILIDCESRHKIVWCTDSIGHSLRVECQVSCPESITILR